MSELRTRDLRAALELALQVACSDDLQAFRAQLMSGLRSLIAYDSVGYNEIDIDSRTAPVLITDPENLLSDRLERRFLALTHQHPLVRRQQAGDFSTYTISDFLTERQFHKLELYQDFYKQLDAAEDQIAFGLPGDVMVAIAINRSSRTFTERDRELLELVRPHLAAACRHAREKERSRALLASLSQDHQERDVGVIQLTPRGEVEYVTDIAQELLSAYLGPTSDRHPLPQRLRAWIDAPRAGKESAPEFVIDSARGRLRVRELQANDNGNWRTLILEERRARAPSVEKLLSFGLTRRQAQVLRLLACGKASRQIAAELTITTATVSKHLEHIYARLGVNNRTQAIARVLG